MPRILLQKHEKPKFVLCVNFAENGDTITGDSSGNILVWGKGNRKSSCLQARCKREKKTRDVNLWGFLRSWAVRSGVTLNFPSVCVFIDYPSVGLSSTSLSAQTPSSFLSPHLCPAGTNRISHVIPGAHVGSIFALCMLRNGTLVSGGKDRRLISWDSSYQQVQTVEVRNQKHFNYFYWTGFKGQVTLVLQYRNG